MKKIFCTLLLFLLSDSALAQTPFIIVQSTTSTQNSGLYDYLLPIYTKKSGVEVRVVAVGTGQAIRHARNGDGDVLLVHSKPDEEQFVADRYGLARHDLMYNDFVIVGPADDPAKIKDARNTMDAFHRIANQKAIFVSRGDDSGTNKKELALWNQAELEVASASGTWYRETGSGMGATLMAAVGMQGYTLTDRATWINFENKQNLEILFEGDLVLFNQYGIIIVNPDVYPHVKYTLAKSFVDWMLSTEGQQAIADYSVHDQQLFYPNAD